MQQPQQQQVYMIPGAPLSAPMAYRQLVLRWLSTIGDLGYMFAKVRAAAAAADSSVVAPTI